MNQTNAEAEVMLEAVAQAARAEYARRDRAELSSDVFAALNAGELEALASQVLAQLPSTGAKGKGRSSGGLVGRGLVGLAAIAAGVLALGLWGRERGLELAPENIAKELVPVRARPALPEPVTIAAGAASWLPDAAGWLCTDSAFIEAGRSDGEPSAPGRSPALWFNVRPGYGDRDATLLNRMDATPFRGQRLRLQARLEVIDVSGSAGLWLRVDGPGQRTLARGRSVQRLSGSQDFELLEVTVDVPPDGEEVVLGAQLSGVGQLSLEDVRLDLVPAARAAAGANTSEDAPPAAGSPALGGPRKRPLRPVP